MKARAYMVSLSILLAASVGALAADETKGGKDTKNTKKAETTSKVKKSEESIPKEKRVLTGSYLKENVRRNGRITDGYSQLIVLDQSSIQRTGSSDLRQLLSRQGVH